MSAKFKNTYRIESARLPHWDYGWEADYFITICTQDRMMYFGNIENGIMIENELGKIANEIWKLIPEQFPYAQIDEYIIMPNHIHGIISIRRPLNYDNVETQFIASPQNDDAPVKTQSIASQQKDDITVKTQLIASLQNDDITDEKQLIASLQNDDITDEKQLIASPPVKSQLIASLQNDDNSDEINIKKGGFAGQKNPLFNENISRIIRWYKGRCSFEIRKLHADFGWQSRFHDHIIRNPQSYENIRNYIVANPQKWEEDTFWKK